MTRRVSPETLKRASASANARIKEILSVPDPHPLHQTVRAGLISGALKPRYHAGVGFAQVYLNEDVRLHLWHPELPTEPESFGCRHDHRFDFTSTVLLGAVTNIFLSASEGARHIAGSGDEKVPGYGFFDEWEVMPAHLGSAEPTIRRPGVDVTIDGIEVIRAGETYSFPKRRYHESRGHGVTLTVMKKFNQEETWAGIIAPRGQPPVHGMAGPQVHKDTLVGLLLAAISKIDTAGWDRVQHLLDGGE
ncbi:hypothetical protein PAPPERLAPAPP_00550 [Brevundimonas phage vB_BpoS-Papperlapapp]|uniref:Uncharacterized protein n=1 Tax=Brevundimonas phage vB_BpoS-Domovoi TaxID=2948598 RepID=A0A9E7SMK9_9CAUD|nr:hypothetical protein DOMOVOI_05320 [Brevundimonas phage vB_BpoS-Domovoi]USN15797.1 hypothetical protein PAPPERLAPAPP_00550 [Brevundimonas phage vB_BpoS-Papperlapapp]